MGKAEGGRAVKSFVKDEKADKPGPLLDQARPLV